MKLCYLLGYPVEHSMSALMHNASFQSLNLPYRYELKSIPPSGLVPFIENELRLPEVKGANVTIPHKQEVIKALDEIDETSSVIGAVNTIVNKRGRLLGYNTDITGVHRALRESFGSLHDIKVAILGAGGASKAVSYLFAKKASVISIFNRTLKKAESLAVTLTSLPECKAEIQALPLKYEALENAVKEADILVNTTSVGMFPKSNETLVCKTLLHSELFVFDLVYNPPQTRLMREAAEMGARVIGGTPMLVYQGAEAFKLWTGRDPPLELMFRTLKESLGAG
ncbi:MAG: shikimate dehydrogenase [Candidatus Thorarchaeota archaeon]|nr:shikimate dehydrogenase [Candidatus Thorarchaeota archaeon]